MGWVLDEPTLQDSKELAWGKAGVVLSMCAHLCAHIYAQDLERAGLDFGNCVPEAKDGDERWF